MKPFLRTLMDISVLAAITFTAFFLGYEAHRLQTPESKIMYEFILPQPEKTMIYPTKDEMQVIVNWIKDEATVDLALAEYEAEHGQAINGYAEVMDGYCNIYAHDFDYLESREAKTFLHETVHCFKGSFHD